jgi:ribosomal subunit interface protein
VDIVVKGRHTEVPERFRAHATEKLAKIARLDPKVMRVDVEVSSEPNPRQSEVCDRIELTVASRGPVVRAEAAAQDPYAALDAAYAKLEARLRKSRDRRKVHHGGKSPVSVASATSALAASGGTAATVAVDETDASPDGDGPMVIREKTHHAAPMSLDQALYEMELVGHDFFLFVDADLLQPSVVYRRRGYDYGVIRLAV